MVAKEKIDVLITGARGKLGRALCTRLNKEYKIVGVNRNLADITDRKRILDIVINYNPNIIIHTAAYTDVDACQMNPDEAYNVNVGGTENIAHAAQKSNSNLIYISTDYVFDGEKNGPYKETDLANPINIYGKTKLEGEKIIQNIMKKYLIIRTSWLFGEGKKSFVDSIIKKTKQSDVISVVTDKYASPTYTDDLADAIAKLIIFFKKRNSWGEIFHITNSGFCSWLEYAKKILEYAKIDGIEIIPIKRHEVGFKASRPKNSVLDNSKYRKIIGVFLRPWQEALKEYIECQRH